MSLDGLSSGLTFSAVLSGIFDLHSHLGVGSVPELRGADDVNSLKGIAQPWLRSLDGINVFDSALKLSISGGVTSSLIFPGSANAIGKSASVRKRITFTERPDFQGGQAYVIKLRTTEEGSPMSMVLEPPFSLNKTSPTDPPHWRHMKHATGENPSRVYGGKLLVLRASLVQQLKVRFEGTRMDTMWAFREAYNEARKLMNAQDEYCAKAEAGLWKGLAAEVPKDIKWEALVDVLRGKVKVRKPELLDKPTTYGNYQLNIHSYSPSDWDGLARVRGPTGRQSVMLICPWLSSLMNSSSTSPLSIMLILPTLYLNCLRSSTVASLPWPCSRRMQGKQRWAFPFEHLANSL